MIALNSGQLVHLIYKETNIKNLLRHVGLFQPFLKDIVIDYLKEEEILAENVNLTNRVLCHNTQFSLEQALEAATKNTGLAEIKTSVDPLVTSITQFAEFGALTNEDKRFATKFRNSVFYTPPVPYITPSSNVKPSVNEEQNMTTPNLTLR